MKTLIFDFDGTIADSFDFVFDLLAAEGKPGVQFGSQERRAFRYKSMPAMARDLGVHWWRLPAMLHKGRRQMRSHFNEIRAFEELPPLIRELNGQGYRMMILSSNITPTIRQFLARHELDDYFVDIYGKVGIFGKGPALRKLIAKHKLSASDCIYIGDEVRDVKSAKVVNLDCIAVTWGFANPQDLRKQQPYAVVGSSVELRAAISKFAQQ